MLHSLIHRKSRGRKPIEDEITSCIFGPLRFMVPDAAWRSLLALFGNPEQLRGINTPTQVDVELWPKEWRTEDGKRVEPDVYIVAWCGENKVAKIIVEVKTVKRRSIDRNDLCNQIHKQWQSSNFCHTDRSLHVFLGPDLLDEVESAIREIHPHMHIVSWHGLANSLKEFGVQDNVPDVWRKDMLDFLISLDVIDFDGFKISLLDTIGKIDWQFHNQWETTLHSVAQLDWSFNQQIQGDASCVFGKQFKT